MSKAVAATKPIGPCEIYWGDVRLGSPKSAATFRYNKETVQFALEDSGVNVGSHKTMETMEVDVMLDDFKNAQNRYTYDAANEFAAAPVINAIAYDESTSTVIRFREDHELSGTASVTLDQAGYTSGTIMVFSSDWSNTPDGYTQGTDFTATVSSGSLKRIGAGITDLSTVHVEYNYTATVSRLGVGGQLADFEATLRIVHINDNGKNVQFYAHRAKKIGSSDIAISMADAFAGIPMTFHVLADLTKPIGKQLFEWSVEA